MSFLQLLFLVHSGPVKTVVVDLWLVQQRKEVVESFLPDFTHDQPICQSPWMDQERIYRSCGKLIVDQLVSRAWEFMAFIFDVSLA